MGENEHEVTPFGNELDASHESEAIMTSQLQHNLRDLDPAFQSITLSLLSDSATAKAKCTENRVGTDFTPHKVSVKTRPMAGVEGS